MPLPARPAVSDRSYAVRKALTIIREPSTKPDPQALALAALGWVLGDDTRSERFLSLTGLTPEVLRDGLGDPATLGAILDYLAAHEADLTAAAEALGVTPQALAAAAQELR